MTTTTQPQTTAGSVRVDRDRGRAMLAVGLALVALVALAAAPYFIGPGITTDWGNLFYLVTLASMWNLLAGYAGMLSVGQQGFIGLGAYGVFVFNDRGVNPYLSAVIAAAVVAAIAFPVSYLAFRLRGGYFAIGTWVIAEVMRQIIVRFESLGAGKGRTISAYTEDPILRKAYTYWLALGVMAVALAAGYALLRSRTGLALQSIRDNEPAAGAVGIRVSRVKRLVFIASAAGCAAAGAVICIRSLGVAQPNEIFGVGYSAIMIFAVVIGGIGTIEGPVVGAVVYYLLDKYFGQSGVWYFVGLGLVAILVTLFLPKGIWGELASRWHLSLLPVGYRTRSTPHPTGWLTARDHRP
ncbi:MAG: branched-chain amino acid ABC transporter permease [Actinobacteria bacterium]|nr:branched-chain amino acid ABC transporter permease [Actinomycetota bacterium]MBI3686711.1 branched-chain amino acid ABC transporter permease [Actinomycetota bacterium]